MNKVYNFSVSSQDLTDLIFSLQESRRTYQHIHEVHPDWKEPVCSIASLDRLLFVFQNFENMEPAYEAD